MASRRQADCCCSKAQEPKPLSGGRASFVFVALPTRPYTRLLPFFNLIIMPTIFGPAVAAGTAPRCPPRPPLLRPRGFIFAPLIVAPAYPHHSSPLLSRRAPSS